MLSNIFADIITMSVAAGICIILFFALRIVTKRLFSSTWHYYMWLAVLCVLIIPFKLDIPNISKVNLDFIPEETSETISLNMIGNTPNTPNTSNISEQHTETTPNNNDGENIRSAITLFVQKLPVIWICGVILSIIYKMAVYFRFALSVKRMSLVCSEKFTADYLPCKSVKIKKSNIKTPFLMGIFNPVIYLPDIEWDGTELEMVLAHETTHLKRKDILYKMLMQVVLCIHWFNPLVYLMNRDMQRHCELSCDEKAISHMDGEKRKIYMKTILNMIVKTSATQTSMTTAMGATKSETEKRICAMIKSKKQSLFIRYISIFTAVIFLTSGIVTASQFNVVNAGNNASEQDRQEDEIIETPESSDREVLDIDIPENITPESVKNINYTNDNERFYEINWSEVSGGTKWLTYEEYIEIIEAVGQNFYVDNGVIRPFEVSPEEKAGAIEAGEALREEIKNGTMVIGITHDEIVGHNQLNE